ncbi:hypothetical protein VTI28DRAFT_2019 [Corynascus sepedonium]
MLCIQPRPFSDPRVSKLRPSTASDTSETQSILPFFRPRYSCRIKGCSKPFVRRYNLLVHLDAHSSAPRPCCRACGRQFPRRQELDRHILSVHFLQRNFRCKHCPRHFTRKDTLAKSPFRDIMTAFLL